MERKIIENWLQTLKGAWLTKDIEKATALFKKTTFYQETPFLEPFTEFSKIKNEWQHIKEQDIKKIEFKILAIENNTTIINWHFERDIKIFDEIYEIKFNNNFECIYFKSWEMDKDNS